MIKKYGLLEPEDAWILSAALDVLKQTRSPVSMRLNW